MQTTYKMTKEDKLVKTVSMIFFLSIVIIFASVIVKYAEELKDNPNADLSEDSIKYIDNLTTKGYQNINLSEYSQSSAPEDSLLNSTGDNKNDFSADQNFGKSSYNSIRRFLYIVFNVPEFIIYDVFRLVSSDWKWFINILDFIWGLFLFLAGYYFIRGLKQ